MMIAIGMICCIFCWLFNILTTVNAVNVEEKQRMEYAVKSFFFWLAVVVAFLTGLKV